MSYQTFPLTPHFVLSRENSWRTIQTRFDSGDVQTRARWPVERRSWRLSWNNAYESEAEELRAFVRDHAGPCDYFYFTAYDKVTAPYAAPVLSMYAGGAVASRSVYVKYTWGNGSYETTASQSRSITLPTGYLVAVVVPYFPDGANRAHIYCGANSSTFHKQSTALETSGGTWNEPLGGYAETAISSPTSNALSETPLVHILGETLEVTKNWIDAYSMSLDIQEVVGQ